MSVQEQKQNNDLIKRRTVCDQSDKMKTIKDRISKFKVSIETVYKDRMINCAKC